MIVPLSNKSYLFPPAQLNHSFLVYFKRCASHSVLGILSGKNTPFNYREIIFFLSTIDFCQTCTAQTLVLYSTMRHTASIMSSNLKVSAPNQPSPLSFWQKIDTGGWQVKLKRWPVCSQRSWSPKLYLPLQWPAWVEYVLKTQMNVFLWESISYFIWIV